MRQTKTTEKGQRVSAVCPTPHTPEPVVAYQIILHLPYSHRARGGVRAGEARRAVHRRPIDSALRAGISRHGRARVVYLYGRHEAEAIRGVDWWPWAPAIITTVTHCGGMKTSQASEDENYGLP